MAQANSTGPIISVSNIRGFGRNDLGTFKMSAELFGWKNRKSGKVNQYRSSEVRKIEWMKTGASTYQIKVHLNEGRGYQVVLLDGFKEENYESIKKHIEEHFHMPLETIETAVRGWHWGEYKWDGNNFGFYIDNKNAFDIYAQDISQVTNPSKRDLAIEFQADDTREADEDQLLEIRFYMPPKGEVDENETTQLDVLKQELINKSGVGETKMDSVSMLNDVALLVPRGRYEIDMGRKALKFHGKSYDYTIQYSNISRMFLLPRPNSPHIAFVLGLENAMRQGQTRYPFVVLQFDNESILNVSVNLEVHELNAFSLEKQMEGKTYDVVTRLFRALVGKSIVVPGDFKTTNDGHGLTCSYRAHSGHLYPLNRSFLFITKPVIFIRYEDVVSVEFSRTGINSQNRFFSFIVSAKGGQEYEFTSLDRNEYKPLVEFLQAKNIRIKNLQAEEQSLDAYHGTSFEEESDDEEFQAEDESSDYESEEDEDDENSKAKGKNK